MAIYHLSIKPISRSKGRSAVAAIAYRVAEMIKDERTGEIHDYTRKQGVEDSFIITPKGAEWAQDRLSLWNAAEAAEKRSNARVAREYEIALPSELDMKERRALAETFAKSLSERYGVAADVAIHAPHRDGDQRNYHAHIMTTTREVSRWGLGNKTRILDDRETGPQEVEAVREIFSNQVNQALERKNIEQRVDHRSLERQGIDRVATIHQGVEVTQIERREMKRARAENRDYHPVTEIGLFNMLAQQGRQVVERTREYVRQGQEWLKEQVKPLKEKLGFVEQKKPSLLDQADEIEARFAQMRADKQNGRSNVELVQDVTEKIREKQREREQHKIRIKP